MERTRCMVELDERLEVGDVKVTVVERYRTTNEFGMEIGYDIYDVETTPDCITVLHSNGSTFAVPIQAMYDPNDNVNYVTMWEVRELNV